MLVGFAGTKLDRERDELFHESTPAKRGFIGVELAAACRCRSRRRQGKWVGRRGR